MTTSEKILAYLQMNAGEHISGEVLAKELSISRNAVWKNINTLRASGHKILAVSNRGYFYEGDIDVLNAEAIRTYINLPCEVNVFETLDSTNTYAKNLNAEENTIVVADTQTKGKGRKDRVFYSPKGSGVYFSIVLRPKMSPKDSLYITTAGCVAVCEAIEELTNQTTSIKWVNDIFLNNKKVCGILTEGSFDLESMELKQIVLGIGINVYPPELGFDDEINDIASFLTDEKIPDFRNKLVASIVNNFSKYYNNLNDKEFLPKYKERSFLIGKTVQVVGDDLYGKVIDIDDECHLIIETKMGIKNLSSGEVSVRLKK